MITKTRNFTQVQSLLYEDELINSPMIRLLATLGLDIEIWLDSAPTSNGVLFIQSPCSGTWDAAQYPLNWKRVWIQSLSTYGVDALIERLPNHHELLFKFHRPWMATYLAQRLELERKLTLFYFTLTLSDFVDRRRHNVTQFTTDPTAQAAELLKNSGRSVDNLRQTFAHPDAAVFGILQEGQLVSGAFVEPRTKRTMEICSVYTHENYRGQGLAASVVSAATHWILEQGKFPVYATRTTNAVSMHLAQSIGYMKYGQVEHYYCPSISNI